jgi:hypothetical protein
MENLFVQLLEHDATSCTVSTHMRYDEKMDHIVVYRLPTLLPLSFFKDIGCTMHINREAEVIALFSEWLNDCDVKDLQKMQVVDTMDRARWDVWSAVEALSARMKKEQAVHIVELPKPQVSVEDARAALVAQLKTLSQDESRQYTTGGTTMRTHVPIPARAGVTRYEKPSKEYPGGRWLTIKAGMTTFKFPGNMSQFKELRRVDNPISGERLVQSTGWSTFAGQEPFTGFVHLNEIAINKAHTPRILWARGVDTWSVAAHPVVYPDGAPVLKHGLFSREMVPWSNSQSGCQYGGAHWDGLRETTSPQTP